MTASIKSAITKQIHEKISEITVWQRNYYEHIIRNEHDLNSLRRYIINNPPNWEYDQEIQIGIPVDEKKKFWTKFINKFE